MTENKTPLISKGENLTQKSLGNAIESTIKELKKTHNFTPVDLAGVFRAIEFKYFLNDES